ncbi:MAG: CCA tRNA nucleotidyltransferase [Clostridia bacterium]|nr:CCA tRNA nucleotidyltransferase [Clostridia bacterium]
MQDILPKSIQNLAKTCPNPLYIVGGSVRDYLAKLPSAIHDWDICSPMSAETFSEIAKREGFFIQAVYRNTGTVKFSDGENEYEYACFRSDKYVRGTHVPVEIFFTDDILLDAKRRDFTVNAIYYDVAKGEFVDPLGGIPAIQERRLTTVDDAKKVFGEDGLRLLRLARQAAQLGFHPDDACLNGAKKNATLIRDISPERIWEELLTILTADQKCGIQGAPYHGFTLLEQTGILAEIMPELTLGKGLTQRPDFHRYDVLEHSLKSLLYIEPNSTDATLRLAALLHDVGKPYCMLQTGNAHAHHEEGARIAKEILTRLKAPKKVCERIPALIEWHMYDLDCKVRENKLRRFFVTHFPLLEDLLLLKQADFSACMDNLSTAPTCLRWRKLLDQMQRENVPFTLKELAVNGNDLLHLGIPPTKLSGLLQKLLLHTACTPTDNSRERLLRLAVGFANTL